MTNQMPTQNQNPPPQQSESILSKITSGFTWWINSLTGRPQPKKITSPQVVQNQNVEPVKQPEPAPGVPDSVSQDLDAFKKLVGKVKQNVAKNVTPVVSKGVAAGGFATTDFAKVVDKGFTKKGLRVFFVVILIILIGFVGIRLFRGNGGMFNGEGKPSPGTASSTPTPLVFEPDKPSAYSEDPVTLKLEQDLNILVREITGTNIREILLNPPTLDFNISFQ